MGFSWQEYWSGLPFSGTESMSPASPALQADSLPLNRVVLLLLNIIGKMYKVSYSSGTPLRNLFWLLIHGSQAQKVLGTEGFSLLDPIMYLKPAFHLYGSWWLCSLSVTEYLDLQCIVPERTIRLLKNCSQTSPLCEIFDLFKELSQ